MTVWLSTNSASYTLYAIDITDLLKKIINDYQFCFLPLEANDPKVKPQDL